MADKFFIAPYDQESGLTTKVKPWLVPDTAFSEINNAYVWRGRVRKRFGSLWLGNTQLTSRLRINIGTTDGAGNFVGNIPANLLPLTQIGQIFSVDTQVFTVSALGAPANMLISGTATIATLDNITGAIVINGADINTDVYFYPSLPVMGLLSYETAATNDEFIIGFDTRFAYQYTGGWERLAGEITPGASLWNGNDAQLFWGSTWSGADPSQKVFFVTNFNEAEPNYMRTYYAGNWDNFRPLVRAGVYMNSARIIVPFKNRLVCLNTWEGAAIPGALNYQNRCRFSQLGSPLDVDAFRTDIPGRGGAIDAATAEAIITAEFVKDRLIVYFERSTWELAYTGNQIYPFTWYQINTELGAESTFSVVPFDKVALGVGNVGIMACNGTNVDRIDDKIPEEVFKIHNVDSGVERVYGIRDYYTEMVYWTFPNPAANSSFPYPNRVLTYNYKNNTWAFNDDSITCFGYFQPVIGITWSSTTITWNDQIGWDSGSIQAKFRQVIAGNQQGYTFICDADVTTNASVLQITDIAIVANTVTVTSMNHNLRGGDYIYIQDITATGNLTLMNDGIYQVIDNATYPLTANSFSFNFPGAVLAGVYNGNGTISRVSRMSIKTKEYNFYAQQGRNAAISKINFMVDRTAHGQLQINFFDSTAITPLLQDSIINSAIIGTGNLDTFAYPTVPFEATATRVWHPVYFQAEGEVIQFQLTMDDTQMRNTDIRQDDFQLHAIVITANPTRARLE